MNANGSGTANKRADATGCMAGRGKRDGGESRQRSCGRAGQILDCLGRRREEVGGSRRRVQPGVSRGFSGQRSPCGNACLSLALQRSLDEALADEGAEKQVTGVGTQIAALGRPLYFGYRSLGIRPTQGLGQLRLDPVPLRG